MTADRATLYRAIVDLLFARAERYETQLRADEVLTGISAAGPDGFDDGLLPDLESVESCLNQLAAWGNVARTRDRLHSTSLRHYENRGYVYGLTQAGEAAHRALQVLEEDVERSGGLQSAMLRNVQSVLLALEEDLACPVVDPAAVFTRLEELHSSFRSMTSSASVFMQQVDRILTDTTVDPAVFRLFKADTIAYLRGFIDDLEATTGAIQGALRSLLGRDDLQDLLRLAATASGDFPLGQDSQEPTAAWARRVQGRLEGLYVWFCGTEGSTAQVELLQRRATSAVLGIVTAVERLGEAHGKSSGGAADFLALARVFQQAVSDEEGHRLFRALLGLAPARHFTLGEEDADLVPPTTSWWDAPSVEVPAKLRTAGRAEYIRRASRVPDYRVSKAAVAEQVRQQQERVDAAAAVLCALGPVAMSGLPHLEEAPFDLLIGLVETALHSAPISDEGTRQGTSLDGRLSVRLTPPAGDQVARVETRRGALVCRDYTVHVQSAAVAGMPLEGVPEPRLEPAGREDRSGVRDAVA
ncbi:TIGR02677 family protein [Actinacidiphila glaucinigra]|uniref:TIGR02677 family protein n=1 Tax=Actinacidiphila glaucinigra TaxID=235986 RepID=UPI003D91A193